MILFTALDPQTNHLVIGRGTDERSAADALLAEMAQYKATHPRALASDEWRINFESPACNWS